MRKRLLLVLFVAQFAAAAFAAEDDRGECSDLQAMIEFSDRTRLSCASFREMRQFLRSVKDTVAIRQKETGLTQMQSLKQAFMSVDQGANEVTLCTGKESDHCYSYSKETLSNFLNSAACFEGATQSDLLKYVVPNPAYDEPNERIEQAVLEHEEVCEKNLVDAMPSFRGRSNQNTRLDPAKDKQMQAALGVCEQQTQQFWRVVQSEKEKICGRDVTGKTDSNAKSDRSPANKADVKSFYSK